MIRLSIIIPFYNVEQYIAQCLDSVYQQNIPEEEYEVICVNDASPDNSREIVKEYQKKHANLILVEHEVNKKLGAARNTGRSMAKGKYIWNVDSDDMIAPNCLKEMLETCEKSDLDVLMFSNKFIVNNTVQDTNEKDSILTSSCLTGIEFMRQYVSYIHLISPVWRQLFRREYMDQNSIYSLEINMSEDVPYTFNAITLAQKIQSVSNEYYIYRCNPESIGGQMRKAPSAIAAYESCFIATGELFHLSKMVPKNAVDVGSIIHNVGSWCFKLYGSYVNGMNEDQRKAFLKLCRKNFIQNIFVIKHLNWRMILRYIRYLLTGNAIREV